MRPTPSRLDMRKLGYSDTMTPPMIPETTYTQDADGKGDEPGQNRRKHHLKGANARKHVCFVICMGSSCPRCQAFSAARPGSPLAVSSGSPTPYLTKGYGDRPRGPTLRSIEMTGYTDMHR